jgi:HEAT repeat protein
MSLALGMAHAVEPKRVDVNQSFSPEKEERINRLIDCSVEQVFLKLKSPEFMSEEEYLNKAIHKAFKDRKDEAVEMAMTHVKSRQILKTEEGPENLYIAKQVLHVFPGVALESLLDLYSGAGPKVRRNVIYVLGEMAGGKAVKDLLVHALDDTATCEEASAETVGDPLRVCDVAYNQLVIRYRVKGVLRTIGTVHNTEVRDHHIRELRKLEL